MNIAVTEKLQAANEQTTAVPAYHFVRGELLTSAEVTVRSRDLGVDFTTPALDLDQLIYRRSEMLPLLDVPLKEIVDFLVEASERLALDKNPHLREALERVVETNPLPRRIVENLYSEARYYMSRDLLETSISSNFAEPEALDGWVERTDKYGNKGYLRAFPPRMIHMLAGNSPSGCISSIAQGALVKGYNLFKMPSSDPFTCVAVLRTLAEIDANHPVVKSMSAVYWRGGDEQVERTLYRPQYFDKIAAWGGGEAITNVIKYLGPGIQLVSFDPKTSISIIGPEGFQDDAVIEDLAEKTAVDATIFNQDACVASRFVYVAGDREGIERYCSKLIERLGVDRDTASAQAPMLPADIRAEVEVLQMMDDEFKVWGKADGRGLVILSEEPVSFHPTGKTVNVVHLKSIDDAVGHVNVATQSIGIYPDALRIGLRDRIANAGGQRVFPLGSTWRHVLGGPHDGMFPLQRFVHWMGDQEI